MPPHGQRHLRIIAELEVVRPLPPLMTPTAIKLSSEQRLKALRVAINPYLPPLEEPAALSPRSARAVASRAFVLSYLVMMAYGYSAAETLARIKDAGIEDQLSPVEHDFLGQAHYSEADLSWACSLTDAALGCAWAMHLVDFHPLEVAPEDLAEHFLSPRVNPRLQIESCILRPLEEIYSQADLHYRLHWASRRKRFFIFPPPVPEDRVRMRRHAFDWIIGIPEDWDNISLDT